MGRMQAEEMKGLTDLDTALSWHLQSNHYPPVPLSMLPICKEAIKRANEGDWVTSIKLPEGCSYRGSDKAPVSAIVEQHHLNSFLNGDLI